MAQITTVFENELLYIISKDHGVSCQSKDQEDLQAIYQSPHFISRLDQPASGLVILAKSPKAAKIFSAHQRKGRVQKQYAVLVEGIDTPQFGELSDKIEKKGSKAIITDIDSEDTGILRFKVNTKLDRYTFLDVEIEGGSFHQIRSQLAHAGMHVKGDLKYGARRSNKEGGIYLCCHSLSMPVDITGIPRTFSVHPSEYSLPLWKFYRENVGKL